MSGPSAQRPAAAAAAAGTALAAGTTVAAGTAARSPDAGRRRWLVSGYFGARNLGDEALLAGLLAGLRTRGARIVRVLSIDPAHTQAVHGVDARRRLRGLPAALLGSDVLVSGGGGLLQDVTSGRSLGYYLGVIRAARLLRRRVVVYGQSLGPLSVGGQRRVQRALRGLPLGLRDAPSLALAQRLGLTATAVADAALALPVPPGIQRDALVLVPRGGLPQATMALRALGEEAQARGLQVEVLACHPALDLPEVARLQARLPGLRRLPDEPPEAALAALAGARLVASVRLHGLVLATVAGVPHVGLAYDPKVAGFAQQSAAPCWPVPSDAPSARILAAELKRVLSAPSLDLAARTLLLREAHEGIDWLVREALHEGSCPSA